MSILTRKFEPKANNSFIHSANCSAGVDFSKVEGRHARYLNTSGFCSALAPVNCAHTYFRLFNTQNLAASYSPPPLKKMKVNYLPVQNQNSSLQDQTWAARGVYLSTAPPRLWNIIFPAPRRTLLSRVSDPHWFNADPDTDPDPAFFLIADPEPGSGSRVWWPKNEKNLQLEI